MYSLQSTLVVFLQEKIQSNEKKLQCQEGVLQRQRKIGKLQFFLELTVLYVNSVVSLRSQLTKTTTIQMYYLLQVSKYHISKHYHIRDDISEEDYLYVELYNRFDFF